MIGLRLAVEELRPGLVIRVGRRGCAQFQRSFFLQITAAGPPVFGGRVWLTGQRLSLAGRPIERVRVPVRTDCLFPQCMPGGGGWS